MKLWLTLGGEGFRTVPGRTVSKGNVGSELMFIERKVSKQRRGEGLEKSQQKTDFFHLMASLRVCAHVGIELESDLNTLMMTFKDL